MSKQKKITSLQIFQRLERDAIAWGSQHKEVSVGDIVTDLSAKRPRKLKISCISVAIGRDRFSTTLKSLTIQYIGRRLKANGEYFDDVGTGILLRYFQTTDGRKINSDRFGVNETISDCGLTFDVEFEAARLVKYPHAVQFYSNCAYPYRF